MRDAWNDEQLLEALRDAMRARRAVPAELIEAAESAYAWHNIDAELAQLTYDSAHDDARNASTRSETASIRALTFTSASLSIELEVSGHSLLGQISPPGNGVMETQTSAGGVTSVPVDEIGCFFIDPKPAGAFRLRCRVQDAADVVTGWITL